MNENIKWFKRVNWYKVVIFAIFIPVIVGAVMISAQHTYEILITLTATTKYYAIGAAAVIDLAMILLGTMSAYNAKLREDITQLNWATWFLIVVSTGINFLHGYMATGFKGGLVAMIYPVVGALAYHFIIWMTTSESRRLARRVLVEKAYVPSSVSKATKKELEGLRADYHVALEKDRLLKLHATTIGTWRQVEATDDYKPTKVSLQQDTLPTSYDYSLDTTPTDVALQEDTSLQAIAYKPTTEDTSLQELPTEATTVEDVVSQVDTILESVDIKVDTPDYLDTSMTIAEMCSLLVANNVVDNPTAYNYINALMGYEVPKKTVQTSMKRARDKVATINN